jgi:hypothetical protein
MMILNLNSFKIPLTNLVKLRGSLYSILGTVFIISFIVSFTSIGFPYSDNQISPRLQRFRVIHTKRSFFNSDGNETFSDINYLISKVDRNSERTLQSIFNSSYSIKDWTSDEKCSIEVFCGFPRFLVFRPEASNGKILKSFEAPIIERTKFSITNKTSDSQKISIFFNTNFKSLTQIRLQTESEWELVESSLRFEDNILDGKKFKATTIHVGKIFPQDTNESLVFKVSL